MSVTIATLFFFLLGLSIGSFLNVVIYRLPRKESLIKPSSHCPSCETPLKWYDNIPLLSYIFLRGRCRSCGMKISLRYPMIELLTGLLFVGVFLKILGLQQVNSALQIALYLLAYLFFTSVLIAVAYIDAEHKIIPNKIIYPGLIIGFLLLAAADWQRIPFSLAGFAFGGGILLIISLLKQAGMGAGDIKLGAFMGLFLGWYVVLALFIASLIGAICGLSLALFKKRSLKEPIPFGPFLTVGGILTFFYGEQIISFYLTQFVFK